MVLSVIKVHRGFISVGLKVFKEKNKQTAISTIFNISDILCSLLLSLEEEDLSARATRRVSAQRYASASRNSPCGRWHLPAATRLRRRRHRWDGRGSVPLWSSVNQSSWTPTAPSRENDHFWCSSWKELSTGDPAPTPCPPWTLCHLSCGHSCPGGLPHQSITCWQCS